MDISVGVCGRVGRRDELDGVGEVKRDCRRTGLPVGECEGRGGR